MPKKVSAGILLHRTRDGRREVLLVHPGGPYWAKKDEGAWTIPKGEVEEGDDPFDTARREFREETGTSIDDYPKSAFVELASLKLKSGKLVRAWTAEGDLDASAIESNLFSMEWPPGSGREMRFPEVDRGAWFAFPEAAKKILPGQSGFLVELERMLAGRDRG